MDNMDEYETSLTKTGFKFLNDYYGINNLATKYCKARKNKNLSKEMVIDWLNEKGKYSQD